MDYDAIILGCGHNGLVAAFYLARAGLRVLALERNSEVGGAATTKELFSGFRFSPCAFWLILFHPQIIDDMQLIKHGLRVIRPDPHGFQPFADGRYIFSWKNQIRTQESVAKISPHDAEALPKYAEFWQRAADLFDPYLLTDPPTLGEFLRSAEGTANESIAHLLVTGTKRQLLDRFFESSLIKASIGTTQDVGYTDGAGGLLYFAFSAALRRRLDERSLTGFPKGGMGAFSDALRMAAETAGAEVRTSMPVSQISFSSARARGVIMEDGTEITANAVLSNADPHRTFTHLVPPEHLPSRLLKSTRHLRMDAGYMKLLCAATGLPDWQALPGEGPQHAGSTRICESIDWMDRAWSQIRTGKMPTEPVLGIVCPSVLDPSMAPPGHHTISVWVEYAPVLSPEKWKSQHEQVAANLIAQVAKYAPNFPDIISKTYIQGPPEIEASAGMTRGNMHHLDMTIDQMLAARPLPGCSAYRTPLDGLYLCGSGCHPGGGVTGVPGHNAAQQVIRDLNV